MKHWYTIKAQHDAKRADIYLFGDIVTDKWDDTEVTAKTFIDELNALDATDIDLYINSPGGAVFEASAIYNALKRHPAEVMVHIDGVAASAASLVAMAGDVIEMGDNALFMIHNPWSLLMVAGDARLIREASARTALMMDQAKDAMLNAYAGRSTLSRAELSAAMDAETWYTAEQALAAGFIDVVFKGRQLAAAVAAGRFRHLPTQLAGAPPAPPAPRKRGNPPQQSGGNTMTTATDTPAAAPPAEVASDAAKNVLKAAEIKSIEDRVRQKTLADDQARRAAIGGLFMKFPSHADYCRELQNDLSCDVEKARGLLLDRLGEGATPLGAPVRVETGEDDRDKFRKGAVQGLLMRAGRTPADGQNEMRYIGFRALAARCLEQAGRERRAVEAMRPMDLVAAAITHSTSDYPNILEDAMHKLIVSSYGAFADTWQVWCKTGQVSDFRPHRRLKLGSFNNLATVNELGEYQSGTLPDAEKENQQADTKGREIRISRQMLVNDDMSVFSDLGSQMGRSAARTVEDDVYALLASNPTMADGDAFFHANHNNLAGAAAAPSVTTLAAAEDAMRSQTDPGGNERLDIRPNSFVGRLSYARTALETYGSEFTPETTGSRATRRVNALFGTVAADNIVGTPRISDNAWYLFADPNEAPALEVAFLDGVSTPFIDQMESLNPDGLRLLVRLDYGVAMIDWRGGYQHPAS